tara:strand:+ start:1838 stop:2557 length:720 start_codon:yes stop_codon:yes gene_type:complete
VNLIFDFGNSLAKIALFRDGQLLEKQTFPTDDLHQIQKALQMLPDVEAAIISNVSKEFKLEQFPFPILDLNAKSPLPFTLNYLSPDTLGIDRIALAAGAQKLYPHKNCLIIDCGTCITYDFLDENSIYHGGGISPGLEMRLKSLAHFTARLPHISKRSDFQLVGKSTEESILSGSIGGFKREVEATIAEYNKRYPSLITIITGGDANQFDYLLKNSIFAAPDFLLTGLNHILEYNAERL